MNSLKTMTIGIFATFLILLPFSAIAQDEGGEDYGEEMDENVGEDMDASMEDLGIAEEEEVVEEESATSETRSKRKEVTIPLEKKAKVVQKKLYPQVMKHEVNVFSGINALDGLTWNLAVGGRYNFRFHEMFGVQATGAYVQSFDKDLLSTIEEGGLDAENVKNSPLSWWGGADFVWYPMYGKFALLSSIIAHYDLGIYAGASAMGLDNGDIHPAPEVGMMTNLYFNRWLSLRVDVTYYALLAEDDTRDPATQGEQNIGSMISSGEKRGGTLLRNVLFGTVGLSFHLPPN